MVKLKTASDPAAFAQTFQAHLRATDPDAAISNPGTMEQVVDNSLGPRRFNLALIGADARDVQWMILRQVSFSPTAAAASGLLIIAVALLAAWGPARRAARIEPSVTLKSS